MCRESLHNRCRFRRPDLGDFRRLSFSLESSWDELHRLAAGGFVREDVDDL